MSRILFERVFVHRACQASGNFALPYTFVALPLHNIVAPAGLPPADFEYTPRSSARSCPPYPHSTPCIKTRGFGTCISVLGTVHTASANSSLLEILRSSKPRLLAESLPAYGCDPGRLPLLRCVPFSSRTTAAGSFRSLAASPRKILCADISARTRCDICNST